MDCKTNVNSPVKIKDSDIQSLADIGITLKSLLEENIKLNHTINEVNVKITNQSIQIDSLFKRLTNVENTNKLLQEENEALKLKLDEQEQYSRRNCVEIHGIPETPGENTLAEVIKVGRAVGMDITSQMIDNCHRLGRKSASSPVTRGIIVKFVRNFDKNNLLRLRKVKRNITSSDLGYQSPVANSIYINENLTQHRRTILSVARKLKTKCNVMYVWTKNGNVFIHENERAPIIKVNSVKDILEIEGKCMEKASIMLNGS